MAAVMVVVVLQIAVAVTGVVVVVAGAAVIVGGMGVVLAESVSVSMSVGVTAAAGGVEALTAVAGAAAGGVEALTAGAAAAASAGAGRVSSVKSITTAPGWGGRDRGESKEPSSLIRIGRFLDGDRKAMRCKRKQTSSGRVSVEPL